VVTLMEDCLSRSMSATSLAIRRARLDAMMACVYWTGDYSESLDMKKKLDNDMMVLVLVVAQGRH
jgi:hypothetical protein